MEQPTHGANSYEVAYGVTPRNLPRFAEQASDDSRRGLLKSAIEMEYGLGTDTSINGNVATTEVYTEQKALSQTLLLLEEAMTNPAVAEDIAKRAQDVYENLSFVGEEELIEATYAIAHYWKAYLNDNPESSLFIITDKTFEAEDQAETDEDVDLGYVSENKSDTYILDKVLSNFSDEELQRYGSRLLLSMSELVEQKPAQYKAIILDDWIMSGQQMQDKINETFEYILPADLEINVAVCNERRLQYGFPSSYSDKPVPIKTYFISHAASHPKAQEYGGAYLTGAHSSGDYPFEGTLGEIVRALNKVQPYGQEKFHMPPLANIIRPYYSPDYNFSHMRRLKVVKAMGAKALAS